MAKRRIRQVQQSEKNGKPKQRFVLFCEGKNTEPSYFSALKETLNSTLVSIETRGGLGVPGTVAQKAVRYVEASQIRDSSFEFEDVVWAVFDRDEHPNYEESVSLCQKHNIGVARSNPCFELWLILHETDYDRPNNSLAVQRQLKKLRPEYDNRKMKTPNCYEMMKRIEDAEKRGDILIKRREEEGNSYGNPSTTVGLLTKVIRTADRLASER